jgi:hypothetical protein
MHTRGDGGTTRAPLKKKLLIVGGLVVAFTLGGGAAVAATNPNAFNNESVGAYNEMYAIVRIGNPIYVHTDSAHGSMDVVDHYIAENGNLVIRRGVGDNEHVVGCQVVADETIARLGIDVGCSGGLTTTQIWMYKSGKRILPTDKMFGKNKANLWVHTVGWDPTP